MGQARPIFQGAGGGGRDRVVLPPEFGPLTYANM